MRFFIFALINILFITEFPINYYFQASTFNLIHAVRYMSSVQVYVSLFFVLLFFTREINFYSSLFQ